MLYMATVGVKGLITYAAAEHNSLVNERRQTNPLCWRLQTTILSQD